MPDQSPNFIERLSAAFKVFRAPDELKNVPFPRSTGSSIVPVWTTWADWDAARASSRNTSNDPRFSSLVMSATRWLGNRLPEAILRVAEPDEGEETKPVPDHLLINLLRRPNAYYSGSTMWKAFAYSWILSGDVYFLKFRNGFTQVSELWYEPHWNVKPRWMNDGQGPYIWGENDDPNAFITYYEVDRGGIKNRVEVEDVVHFRDGIDPNYPRCGLSAIASILREIFGDSQVADYAGRLLGNGGVPPYVLSLNNTGGLLKQEDIDGIKDRLMRQTSGAHSGEPLVIADATVEKLGFSPKDMDQRVSRYLFEERFCAVVGIPAVVLELGVGGEKSTYNNVKEAQTRATENYLVPLWGHIGEELTVQLLPDFEKNKKRFVEHDFSQVRALQEDEDAIHKRVGTDYQNGLITRKEARLEFDLEVDDALDDVYFVRSGSSTKPATEPIEPLPDLTEVPVNGGVPVQKRVNIAYKMKSVEGLPDARVEITVNRPEPNGGANT